MRSISPVRLYCAAIFFAGCGSIALLAPDARFDYVLHDPIAFAIVSAGVLLGEMLPIKVSRKGNDEVLTLSASFAMALLLIGGFGPAVIAQSVASIVQDVSCGKPSWRIRFNVGQYALSMAAAWLVIRTVSGVPDLHLSHPLASSQLPAMLLGAGAFFIVNSGTVGIAFALHQRISILSYFTSNSGFSALTACVMLLVAPIVLAAAAYSVAIVPLCLVPVVAMYNSISQSARSEHAARHDSLTGLPNRAAFREAVARTLSDARVPGCVLLIDLDRFKDVNDTLGHRYGDLLLIQVAERFRSVIGAQGVIARLGGDEFALIGPERDQYGAGDLAERIAASLRAPFQLEQMVVDTQASVGIALFPEHGAEVETLLQKADVAMYRAKETQTDVALYDERHDHHSPAKLALTAELRSAVEGERIVVWYQPELDFATGDVTAVEALVRWEHPRLGTLPPSAFVRIAEQTNLIKPLTRRVIDVALSQVADWRAVGLDIAVAVNISPQVLVDRPFTAQVMESLHRAQVPPCRLKLEVTESALMSDPLTARTVLRELDRLGVEISIDDFGTGYSSLAYLADLPVSEVKIDRSFVSRMAAGSSEKIIVNSTIDLAHHLGLRAVAEGVQHPSLLAELRALGCDAAQGFAISHPLPSAEATRWLLDRHGCDGERAPMPSAQSAAADALESAA
jgi:diguanylate cyclase (GGDEF)-like protein